MTRNFQLPKLYPITDRNISGVSHEQQAEKLVAGGASIIQVRDKSATSRDLCRAVQACRRLLDNKDVKLIVNDRVDIALIAKGDGVHLGQDDLPPDAARKILGSEAIIGLSTHTVEQAAEAMKLPIDYIAFGPIFETGSKTDHETAVGLDALVRIRNEIGDFPIVAIGGIRIADIKDIFTAGADSVAMIASLLSDPANIAGKTAEALELTSPPKC